MGNTLARLRATNKDANALHLKEEPKISVHSLTSLLESYHALLKLMQEENPGNPGSVAELHNKCKALHPVPLIGGKLSYNIRLDTDMQLKRAFMLGDVDPNVISPYPALMGEVDSFGNVYAKIAHDFTQRVRCAFAIRMRDRAFHVAQLTTDYRTDDATASLSLGNPQLLQDTGVITGSYLKALTRRVAVGTEISYQYGPHLPQKYEVNLNALLRYQAADGSQGCLTLSPRGLHATYCRKLREHMQIGIELKSNKDKKEMDATIAYQFDLPRDDVVLRASIDNHWTVCCVVEKHIEQLPLTVMVSGRVNHVTSDVKFGCALTVG